MKLTHTRMFAAAGVIAGLAIAMPAFAGQSDRRASDAKPRTQTTQSERRAAPREEPRQAAPARPSTPPQGPVASRPSGPQQERTSPVGPSARGESQGRAVQRPQAQVPQRPQVQGPQARSFGRDERSFSNGRPGFYNSRPGFYHGRVTRFYQPYFAFRPQVRLGFGLFVGFPVVYPGWYDRYDPYYGRYVAVAPLRYGGISFDIDPGDAAIFIDGTYMGVVDDFSPYDAPLELRAGLHRVELRARGCQPMVFDLTVVPGQVIPYRGTLAFQR